MSDPKNPNKNKKSNKSHNINLTITNDISNNPIKNPLFPPLHHSKEDKNGKDKQETTENKKTDINSNNVLFSMKMNGVLNELRKNREKNDTNRNDKNKKIITESLDLTFKDVEDPSKNLSLVPYNKPVSKKDMNDIVRSIQDKYNLLYNNDLSANPIKPVIKPKHVLKNTGTQFPPTNKTLFDSLFIQGKRPNSWNVGNGKTTSTSSSWNPSESWNSWDKKWSPPSLVKKPPPPPPPLNIKKTKVVIEREINGLNDILKLIEDYPLKFDVEYNINMKAMHDIKKPLTDLNNMIGMNKLII